MFIFHCVYIEFIIFPRVYVFDQILYSKQIPDETLIAQYRWNAAVMYMGLSSLSEHVMSKDDKDTVSKNIVCTLYAADLFINTLKSMRQNRIRPKSTCEERAEAPFAENNAAMEIFRSKVHGDKVYLHHVSASYVLNTFLKFNNPFLLNPLQ